MTDKPDLSATDGSLKTEDRRLHARRKAAIKVQLIGSDSLPMHMYTTDISLAGMSVDCDRQTAQHLSPPGEAITPAQSKQFTARFSIPVTEEEDKTLTLFTKVINVQRVAQDKYHANIRFVSFGGHSQTWLESYLETLPFLT